MFVPVRSCPARSCPAREAIIFDLDGTLIDSADDIGGALAVLLAEVGRRSLDPAEVRSMIGDGATQLVCRAFAATGAALPDEAVPGVVARYLDLYADGPVSPGCLYPGVIETLEALSAVGMRLGLCTNKPQRITVALLAALDLARFFGDAVLGTEVLAVRKPDPAPLLWVLERLGRSASQAVMVGDGRNDVLAARGAGMPVVAVSYGYCRGPVSALGADRVIDTFAALPLALEGLR